MHRQFQQTLAFCVLSSCIASHETSFANDVKISSLSPSMPYSATKSSPVTHQVDFSVIVTPPYHCKVLKVWIPIPQTDSAQEICESQFSTFPTNIKPSINTEPVYGNQFAYFEFHDPQGAQIIRHQFQAKLWNLHWDLKPTKILDVNKWPTDFAPYLQPQSLNDEREFQSVLNSILPQQRDQQSDLFAVMNWIDETMTYDHVDASLQADANHAFEKQHGHCSDYHGLCATMGRMIGRPTRVTYGLALYPKNSPSHCKMEAFLPPYGWVSFDLSETQKLVSKIQSTKTLSQDKKEALAIAARDRLKSGFRENSWLLVTKGTNYELAPRATKPVKVVRTAYIEADGEPLPEPDPANPHERKFSWMTSHRYSSSKPIVKPFADFTTLEKTRTSESE